MSLIPKLRSEILTHKLFASGDTIVVGVSGGADSVCLLMALNQLRQEFGFKLIVAHYNHQLRVQALRDQKSVEHLAKRLGLKFVFGVWKRKSSKELQGSLEDLARQKRFDFLIKTAIKYNADAISLAHNQNDWAETVLMKILRGTGLQGLRGILKIREIGKQRIVRPLLNIQRAEIETYLKDNQIKFCNDVTNRDTKFFRNKIRLKLLPYLAKDFSPNIKELLAHLAEGVGTDYDYLYEVSKDCFEKLVKKNRGTLTISLKKFLGLHLALKRMIIRLSVEYLQGDMNRMTLTHLKEVEAMLDAKIEVSEVNFTNNIVVRKNKDFLKICQD